MPQQPQLTFLATVSVDVGEPIEIGQTPDGVRRVIPIVGGTVTGPKLNGRVLAAGADYQLLRSPTLTELVAKYVIETHDGARIFVSNVGLRSGSEEDTAALVRGAAVDPERIYFRCTPKLSTASPQWSWLNSRILIATAERYPDAVFLHLYVVD